MESSLLSSTAGRYLDKLFLFSDNDTLRNSMPNWRISSLRIILFCAVLITLIAIISTYNSALSLNLLYVVVITIVFFSVSIILLLASRLYYIFCAHTLLLLIVTASLVMNLFLTDIELAKVGSMLMYTCPVIAFIIIGYKTAIFYALLNIIPLYLIVNNIDLSVYSGVTSQLPSADRIINILLFLFFNICIPLAVARTSIAAKRLNESTLRSAYHLKEKKELYRTFFTQSSKIKVVVDEFGKIVDFNNQARKLFNLSKQPNGHNVTLEEILFNFKKKFSKASIPLIEYNGSYVQVTSHKVIRSNFIVYEFNDCTKEEHLKNDLLETEQENKRLRYFDKHTSLPNKLWFELKCKHLLSKYPTYKKYSYIIVLQNADNEYFQLKYGKNASKIMIADAYKQLIKKVDDVLACAYIGSNQLALLMNTPSKKVLKTKILTQIKPDLDSSFEFKHSKFKHSFIFGCDAFSEKVQTCETVLNNAISALKQSNKNNPFNCYNELKSKLFIEKYEISILLDEALKSDELDIFYQPKVLANGKCIGLEALTRWNSSTIGTISPAIFIPIAEEYGMIDRLTDFVIKNVCSQLSTWNNDGVETVTVAINISLINFNKPKFMSNLVKNLADFTINPQQIELELTETALETNQEYSINLLKSLQSWGFIISIDDFGVGYSNISRIADFPIDKLKLDRSLINKITTSSRQIKLAKVILFMCKELDIQCVAEGVETQEQVEVMSSIGCQEFQGFYFSKPLSVEDYEKHINQHGLIFDESTNYMMVEE
ncbi:EAL domain-containing protein [Colwellia sp. E150_009]